MIKNKKFIVILAVTILSAALLTSCSVDDGGETQLEGNPEAADNNEFKDNTEDQAVEDIITDQPVEDITTDQDETQSQDTIIASGTLIATDAATGTVTITTKDDDELILEVTSESKIQIDDSLSTLDQLATKIGSEVSVEYQAETKTVTVVSV